MRRTVHPFPATLSLALALAGASATARAMGGDWDSPSLWSVETDGQSALAVRPGPGIDGVLLDLAYDLKGPGHRWVQIRRPWEGGPLNGRPLTLLFRARSQASLEIKIIDMDGSNFICRYPLGRHGELWEPVVLYRDSFEYGWGGDGRLDHPKFFAIAIAGEAEKGVLALDEIGYGRAGEPPTPVPDGPRLDPDRHRTGWGAKARRARKATPEDPGVLEWLKAVQDTSSLEKRLLPAMEDNRAQTFNNALAAMAFILKGERERAERILDFFAESMDPSNDDPVRQSFFLDGEPRGFYQEAWLRDGPEGAAYDAPPNTDRWVGDMAWLLIAYQYYGRRHDPSRYARVSGLILDLLLSFMRSADRGAYVQHGWRRGDSALHENVGHAEANLDAYAAFRLAGREEEAREIKIWLNSVLVGSRLPLDLYTWRVLALGPPYADALAVPENDLRYRKTVRANGRAVTGFFHGPDIDANNLWIDGLGHMACAYYAAGNDARGNFYAGELDALLIDRVIEGRRTRALPYTVNAEGGYGWVRTDRGFVSTAAWYIFAKNRFNPMTLRAAPPAE